MTSEINTVVNGFPHPTIPACFDEPTYASIAAVNLKLNANATSVQSNLGDGNLGHLALTVTPEDYATLSQVPFVVPANPGPQPIIPANATHHIILAVEREHKAALRTWLQYTNTDKALKQQLLAAFKEMYYKALCHRKTGYATISTLQILTHLYRTYGKITPADLVDNLTKLNAPYNPALPIVELFQQIEDCQDLAAAANNPFSDTQVVTYAYNNVYQTGMFAEACREWRRLPTADHTWATFKTHFASAHQEYKESLLTAQSAGYHAANAIIIADSQATRDALANLASATASDRSTVSQITNASNQMNEQLERTTARLEAALADIAALQNKQSQGNWQQSNRTTPRSSNSTASTNSSSYSSGGKKANYTNNNYCWTHGYHIHNTHTSANCNKPKPGHKKDATRSNTMDGSTAGKHYSTG
jgi:hypothetical protein